MVVIRDTSKKNFNSFLKVFKMLKLIDKSSWAAPLTIFATHLNAPCSSILLAQSQAQRIYLVVGKINGEVRFRYF